MMMAAIPSISTSHQGTIDFFASTALAFAMIHPPEY